FYPTKNPSRRTGRGFGILTGLELVGDGTDQFELVVAVAATTSGRAAEGVAVIQRVVPAELGAADHVFPQVILQRGGHREVSGGDAAEVREERVVQGRRDHGRQGGVLDALVDAQLVGQLIRQVTGNGVEVSRGRGQAVGERLVGDARVVVR